MFIYACATPASGVLNKYTAASTNKALTIVSTPFQQQGTPLNGTGFCCSYSVVLELILIK